MLEDTTARTADSLYSEEDEPTPAEAMGKLAEALGVSVPKETADEKAMRALIHDIKEDWRRLNAFLNATAAHYSWCGDYERRVASYNAQFKVLKLEGRSAQSMPPRGNTDGYQLPETLLERISMCPTCRTPGNGSAEANVRASLMQAEQNARSVREYIDILSRLYTIANRDLPQEAISIAETIQYRAMREHEFRDPRGGVWRLVREEQNGG